MVVSSLALTNFRSYVSHQLDLHPAATVIVGPNATGKTNLLESLYVLANTRSFRAKDAHLIHHNADFLRVVARVGETEVAYGYQNSAEKSEKKITHDNVARTLISHLGTLKIVLFEPNDLLLIFGPPDRRRRYLDYCLSQANPGYTLILQQYRRVLAQRNRLLGEWNGNEAELFAWNVKLTELASNITTNRLELIADLNAHLGDIYAKIAGSPEQLELQYEATVSAEDYASAFIGALQQNLRRDLGAGFTTIGPHRDDSIIRFRGGVISASASRGEMRTVILALKLAELDYIERHTKTTPLLLLDDVFSELDESRRRFLLQTLSDRQTIITTTSADSIDMAQLENYTIVNTGDVKNA